MRLLLALGNGLLMFLPFDLEERIGNGIWIGEAREYWIHNTVIDVAPLEVIRWTARLLRKLVKMYPHVGLRAFGVVQYRQCLKWLLTIVFLISPLSCGINVRLSLEPTLVINVGLRGQNVSPSCVEHEHRSDVLVR